MKKNGIKIVAALIGVVGVFLIYKYIKGKKDIINDVIDPKNVPTPPITIPTGGSNDKYPLSKGSKGANVVLLQQALMGLVADGIFGSKTEAALVAQTGKKSVASQKEILAIASKNGLGYKMESNGKIVLIPKSQ